jgi:hypothetical protein
VALMKAEAREEGRAAPPLGGDLEKSLAALAQAHYEKDLPEMPGSTASVAKSPSKEKGLKRPASVSRMPSARTGSLFAGGATGVALKASMSIAYEFSWHGIVLDSLFERSNEAWCDWCWT